MKRDRLDKIINFIREQVAAGSPTMSVGNVGYTSKGGQTRAGFDPVQGKLMRRRRIIGQWSRSLRGKKSES